jgi:plastocyanin
MTTCARRALPLPLILAAALAGPALADGGTVTGKVEATPAKYLEETVVYLKGPKGAAKPQTRIMDQKAMAFIPHVMAVTVGDTVKFQNHDGVVHNVYSPDNEGFNLGSFKQEEERSYTFNQEGAYSQLCSMHPEMLAYIFVAPTPYAAAVDKKGNFTIANVPPGTWQVAIWNSRLKGAEKSVTVAAGQTVTVSLSVKRGG